MAMKVRKPVDRNSLTYLTEAAKVDFALELVASLERLKITKQQLAERIGVKAPYLTRLLRGDENLTIATMVKVADSLGKRLNIHLSDRDCHVRWLEVIAHSNHADNHPHSAGDWRRFGQHGFDIENNGAANDYEIESIAA